MFFFSGMNIYEDLSYLKYTSVTSKIRCKLKGNSYFIHVYEDKFYIVYIDFYDMAISGK